MQKPLRSLLPINIIFGVSTLAFILIITAWNYIKSYSEDAFSCEGKSQSVININGNLIKRNFHFLMKLNKNGTGDINFEGLAKFDERSYVISRKIYFNYTYKIKGTFIVNIKKDDIGIHNTAPIKTLPYINNSRFYVYSMGNKNIIIYDSFNTPYLACKTTTHINNQH